MGTTKTTKTAKVETKAADKVEAVKVEAPKAEVKKETAPKAAVKKEAAPKAEAKKAPAKKEAAPKAEVKKAPVKKAAAPKKAPAKKTVAPKKVEEVFIEYAGTQVSTSDIVARVVEATGKKASAIKTLNVYVQPETGIIYYTVDGTEGKINY